MNYRLAAIDLDGTLLHSGTHAVSVGNAAAIARALDRGATIVLASGRQHGTIAAFAAPMGVPIGTPIISYNGALTRRLGGETMSHQPVPAEAAQIVVRYCAEHGHHLNYYLDDVLYVRELTRWAEVYQYRTGSVPEVANDLTRFDGRRPTKLLLISTPEITDALLAHFQALFGDSLYITKTEDEYLEFMNRGVSKGVALARVADALGITPQECVAIGDSYNDIPMLQWAGLGVAMSSGRAEVKAIADTLAPPADDDGVGVILDQLFP